MRPRATGEIAGSHRRQFRQNTGCAAQWILSGHATHQVSEFALDWRPTAFFRLSTSIVVEFESLSVPFDDRFSPGRWPSRIASCIKAWETRPRRSDHGAAPGASDCVAIHGNLLPQGEDLGGQVEPGHQQRSDQKVNRPDNAHAAVSEGCGGTPILLPEPPNSKRRKSLTDSENGITNRERECNMSKSGIRGRSPCRCKDWRSLKESLKCRGWPHRRW